MRSNVLLVDGTFGTTECGVPLTVLLAILDGIAVPCAYLLSDSREAATYKSFFKVWRH
jgi:hypothetical protein